MFLDLDHKRTTAYATGRRRILPVSVNGMAERYWILKSSDAFASLPPDELRQLEARSRAKWFAAGATIYVPADMADGVLMVGVGRVRICCTSPDGKQAILAFIDPGELFGELALFGERRRDELAEAMERSLVLLIPRDDMMRMMQAHSELSIGVTKMVGLRRQRIERRLKSILFRSVRQRLVELLLELAERYGVVREEGVEISMRLSHQDLASAIGSTRESVTLLLGQLDAEHLVSKGRRRVTLLAPERLRNEATGEPDRFVAQRIKATRA